MKIVGKCAFTEYIAACRNKLIKGKNNLWCAKVNDSRMSYENKLFFFNNIKNLKFKNFILDVEDCDVQTFLFYEYFLEAIEDKDPKLREYLKVFTHMEELHVTRNGHIKFDICCYVNRRGVQNLDIDYLAIHEQNLKMKEFIPSIKIYTVLGQN